MRDLLYLTHRIPYPPNKGDKIRAFHVLRYLSAHYRVHLGSFIDDPADMAHAQALVPFCTSQHLVPLHPWLQAIKACHALSTGQALSVAYYRHSAMYAWVENLLSDTAVVQALAFSGAMAQYLPAQTRHGPLHRVLDLVDVDSEKWRQYAAGRRTPRGWIYRREAVLLRRYETDMARRFDKVLLVSPAEAELFRRCAPELAHKVDFFSNGVDSKYFSPEDAIPCPYDRQPTLVFTGAMDYRPNIDAAIWFAQHVLPAVQKQYPAVQFHIVGARPSPNVQSLGRLGGVHVSGTVADIRPYLQHATLVVVPLQIARGIQNKVLEAMAMAKTVIATPEAMEGIQHIPAKEVLVATSAADFISCICAELQAASELGQRARKRVLQDYQWDCNLRRLGQALDVQSPDRCSGGIR